MKHLAPIGVSTYSRLNHLKQTITALQNNALAKQSKLYIFSDAPKPGDEKKVAKIREYIQIIDGFKDVIIVERKTNGRVANGRGGIKQLLDEYGRMIFLEDDIVTAPGFLKFMNSGLEFYKNDERVFAIVGYKPPIDFKDYNDDFYFDPLFSGWGIGFWKRNYEQIQSINRDNLMNNKILLKKMKRYHSSTLLKLMKKDLNREIDAMDVKIIYTMVLNDFISVVPNYNLVKNIGFDGSGLHTGMSNRYDTILDTKKIFFEFKSFEALDGNILRQLKKFRCYSLKENILNKINAMLNNW